MGAVRHAKRRGRPIAKVHRHIQNGFLVPRVQSIAGLHLGNEARVKVGIGRQAQRQAGNQPDRQSRNIHLVGQDADFTGRDDVARHGRQNLHFRLARLQPFDVTVGRLQAGDTRVGHPHHFADKIRDE